MQSATKKNESAALEPAARKAAPAPKRAKLSVLLVTRDDQLWPQVGGNLGQDLVLKQVDSIDELLSTTTSGQPAIVLLDARGEADAAAALSRLQLHSPRFAVVALDDVGSVTLALPPDRLAPWLTPFARELFTRTAPAPGGRSSPPA